MSQPWESIHTRVTAIDGIGHSSALGGREFIVSDTQHSVGVLSFQVV